MNLLRNISIGLIVVSFLVLGLGLWLVNHYAPKASAPVILDADWDVIENTVADDIGSVGYRFLSHGTDIPAVESAEFEQCYNRFVDVTTVGSEYTREYLFKYNQIVRIRMLRAGIDCKE